MRFQSRRPSRSKTARLALAGCTVTVATEAGVPVTWIVSESLSVSLVAMMVAKPGWRPVTEAVSPMPSTSATAGSLLVHDTDGFGTGAPFAPPTAATKVILPPTPTDVGPVICKKAPPAPASVSDTGRFVVLPATISTAGVIDAARKG